MIAEFLTLIDSTAKSTIAAVEIDQNVWRDQYDIPTGFAICSMEEEDEGFNDEDFDDDFDDDFEDDLDDEYDEELDGDSGDLSDDDADLDLEEEADDDESAEEFEDDFE